MSSGSQDETIKEADMSGATRPQRATQPPLGQLRIEFEKLKDKLEQTILEAATTTDSLAVTQVLTNIDTLHTEMYLMYSKLKRTLNKTGAKTELLDVESAVNDITDDMTFMNTQLTARLERTSSNYTVSVTSVRPKTPSSSAKSGKSSGTVQRRAATRSEVGQHSQHISAVINHEEQETHQTGSPILNEPDVPKNPATSDRNGMYQVGEEKNGDIQRCHTETLAENMERFFSQMPEEPDDVVLKTSEQKETIKLNPKVDIFQPRITPTNYNSDNVIPQLLLKKDAMAPPKIAFDNDPLTYKAWETKMLRVIAQFALSPDEVLDLLEAHTTGQALSVVSRFRVAVGFDPDGAVSKLWAELQKRFGTSPHLAKALQNKLYAIPGIGNDLSKLGEFADECEMVLLHMDHVPDLVILNFTQGLSPLFNKMPMFMRNKWQTVAYRYSCHSQGGHPPFSVFCKFLAEQVQICTSTVTSYNDQCQSNQLGNSRVQKERKTFKTDTVPAATCVLHKGGSHHSLADCREFQKLALAEKLNLLKQERLCFRCFASHQVKSCQSTDTCSTCKSAYHHTQIHQERRQFTPNPNTQTNGTQIHQERRQFTPNPNTQTNGTQIHQESH